MDHVTKEAENSRTVEEYKIVEKKLKKANESLKDITIEQIKEALAQAEKKKVQ